jgi:hypothetical protein
MYDAGESKQRKILFINPLNQHQKLFKTQSDVAAILGAIIHTHLKWRKNQFEKAFHGGL